MFGQNEEAVKLKDDKYVSLVSEQVTKLKSEIADLESRKKNLKDEISERFKDEEEALKTRSAGIDARQGAVSDAEQALKEAQERLERDQKSLDSARVQFVSEMDGKEASVEASRLRNEEKDASLKALEAGLNERMSQLEADIQAWETKKAANDEAARLISLEKKQLSEDKQAFEKRLADFKIANSKTLTLVFDADKKERALEQRETVLASREKAVSEKEAQVAGKAEKVAKDKDLAVEIMREAKVKQAENEGLAKEIQARLKLIDEREEELKKLKDEITK